MTTNAAQLAAQYLDLERSNDWTKSPGTRDGKGSGWANFYYPHETAAQGRWEGEIDELVVYGHIPEEISGTFYRIIIDPYMPRDPRNGFVEGDGNICAIRIQDGKASLKMKYVETERYLLEREAGRPLFGVYRNPYTNDPSTRYANDSTGNTNIIYWGGNVLALAERGLPWAIDPDTLETRRYDPYAGQVRALTFTAHPKYDPKANELVTWGYEAKGLLTTDIVTYNLTEDGKARDVNWYSLPENRMVHDGWITENWIILSGMPMVSLKDEELRAGSQHWIYVKEKPQLMIVSPRRPNTPRDPSWKLGEFRQYECGEPGMIVHCGAAWEDETGALRLESQWSDFNPFYFWDPPNAEQKPVTGKYVRWTINPSQPTGSKIMPTNELLPWWNEFPLVDDRFNTTEQHITYMVAANVLYDGPTIGMPPFNSILKLDTKTGKTLLWDSGKGGQVAEPCFIPRSDDAPEGDGWLLVWTAREAAPRGEMILLDTNDFSEPVAVIQMPFVLREQLHGNWVQNPNPGTKLPRLTKPLRYVQPTAIGPLNRI